MARIVSAVCINCFWLKGHWDVIQAVLLFFTTPLPIYCFTLNGAFLLKHFLQPLHFFLSLGQTQRPWAEGSGVDHLPVKDIYQVRSLHYVYF